MGTPPTGKPTIDTLREQLAELDGGILELVARRQSIVKELGRLKAAAGRGMHDYAQEKEVIDRARRTAAELRLSGDVAEQLMSLLIRSSLIVQEHDRVQAGGEGGGRKVLIIGGAGRMGRWLARFLASQGFAVEIADPAGTVADFAHLDDWRSSPLDHDLIIVATPLRTTRAILEELATRRPAGLVFDVGSLKTPLKDGLLALAEAGVAVTSIHPMFGPDTELLFRRHVIFVDVGAPEATRRARELFAATMAIQVDMDLESHDRLVAYVLGLSHALNIAFFTALAESGETAQGLAQLSSTTFDAQLQVARNVAAENPHLYFEIQALNRYGLEALASLSRAVTQVHAIVQSGDEQGFVEVMRRGEQYLRALARR